MNRPPTLPYYSPYHLLPPPSDPLNWAYTNDFTVCCYCIIQQLLLFLSIQRCDYCAHILCLVPQPLDVTLITVTESTSLYLPCVLVEARKEKHLAAVD